MDNIGSTTEHNDKSFETFMQENRERIYANAPQVTSISQDDEWATETEWDEAYKELSAKTSVKQFIQEMYDKGDYIFPSAIAFNLKIKIEHARECLEQLATEGMLQRIYAVSHGCNYSEDIVNRYTSMEDIDDYAYCDVCMCEYDPKTHMEIEYKLIS